MIFNLEHRILKLLIMLILSVLGGFAVARTFPPRGMQGDGSVGNPYQIKTAKELNALAAFVNSSKATADSTRGQHYRVMNDIDLTEFIGTKAKNPEGWQPIGIGLDIFANERWAFQGYFHGGGHVISGLRTNWHSADSNHHDFFFNGLFGIIENATIDSLGVEVAENDSLRGMNYTGILAGMAFWNCNIRECYAKGTVVGQVHVGGLVGFLSGSVIENCYTDVHVFGRSEYKGGLVGHIYYGGSVKYCYSSGYVEGYQGIGGLVGNVRYASPTVKNCFVQKSKLDGARNIGKIIGDNFESSPKVSHCYVNNDVSLGGNGGYHNGIEKNAHLFKDYGFFINPNNWDGDVWNFYDVWIMASNNTHPILRWQVEVPEDAECKPFATFVKMRWDNTLTVVNNPDFNGGYTFIEYTWYRNGDSVGNQQSWSAGVDAAGNPKRINPSDTFYVKMVTSTYETMATCPGSITYNVDNVSLAAFPNPVSYGQTLYLEVTDDEEMLKDADIEVYDLYGNLVQTIHIQLHTLTPTRSADGHSTYQIPVEINYPRGYYVIALKDKKQRKDIKILVQ